VPSAPNAPKVLTVTVPALMFVAPVYPLRPEMEVLAASA